MGDRVIVIVMCLVMAVCTWSGVQGNASAQSLSSSLGVVPYPSKGQSPQQQTKDEGECFTWAKQQTGIDPMATAATPPPRLRACGGRRGACARCGAGSGRRGGDRRHCRRHRQGRGHRRGGGHDGRRRTGQAEQGGPAAAGAAGQVSYPSTIQQGLLCMHGGPRLYRPLSRTRRNHP